MKLFLFFLFIFIISLSYAQAVGFSPTSLIFNLEPGEKNCKIVSLTSESPIITVVDNWALDYNVEWEVGLFKEDSSSHGIDISYDNELDLDERKVEVCLSGSEVGEYHGVLLLSEQETGNSVTQMGIWLKVVIGEGEENVGSDQSGEGVISGGSVTGNVVVNNLKEDGDSQENLEEVDVSKVKGVTGNVAGGGLVKSNYKVIGGFLVGLVVIGVVVFNKRKNIGEENL